MTTTTEPTPTPSVRITATVLARVPWSLLAALATVGALVGKCGPIEEWGDPL